MKLDPRVTAAGVPLVAHTVLGSTNAEALRLAREGERGPLWVMAERQTAGRGRRGRTWVSEPGNLYASLLLTAPAPAERWPQLSFVAALAGHDAIISVAAHLKALLTIKWPNDLLLAGAKCAGILVEGEGGDGGVVAIGLGINCASHPLDTDHPAADLAAAGAIVAPSVLLSALSVKMLGRLAQWNGGEGFSAIRADWLARAAGLGQDARVRLDDRDVVGRFDALDRTGALIMRLPGGNTIAISAGDVFLSTSSSSPMS